jgi:hypothetical protein
VAGFGEQSKEPYSDFFKGDGFLDWFETTLTTQNVHRPMGHIEFHKNVQGTNARRYDACFLVQNVVTSLEAKNVV